jgi:hypothetical protein
MMSYFQEEKTNSIILMALKKWIEKEKNVYMLSIDKVYNMLFERIEITVTDYGDRKPFTNQQFSQDSEELFTYFVHEQKIIVVSFNKIHFSFNFFVLDKDNRAITNHSHSEITFKRMQSFYGKLLFILREVIERYGIKHFMIYSDPSEKSYELYKTFANNVYLINIVKSFGFKYFKKDTVTSQESNIPFEIYHFFNDRQTTQSKKIKTA